MGPAGAKGLEEEDGAEALGAGALAEAAPALCATEELPQPFMQTRGIKAAKPRSAPRIRRA
jgi:hypothetical protein